MQDSGNQLKAMPPSQSVAPPNETSWNSDSLANNEKANVLPLATLRSTLDQQSSTDPLATKPSFASTLPNSHLEDKPLHDENIIDWADDDDPEHPFNWPAWQRNINASVITFLGFLTPLSSCK